MVSTGFEEVAFGIEDEETSLRERVGVFWLPASQDMGLIGGDETLPGLEAERSIAPKRRESWLRKWLPRRRADAQAQL